MTYKAFFFDIDFTLYDHKAHKFVQSGLEAIKEAKAKGLKIFLCSARSYDSIESFGLFKLGIDWDGYVSSCGALAYADGTYVRKKTVKPQYVRKFDALCRKLGLTYELVTPKDRRFALPKTKIVARLRETYKDVDLPYKPYGGEEVISMLVYADARYDKLFKERLPMLKVTRFAEYGADVADAKIPFSKGQGIKAILDYFGIKKEEAAAFGDGTQDIAMKEGAGTLVAMGNGVPELKEAADMVTDEISKDGLAKAIKALLEKK